MKNVSEYPPDRYKRIKPAENFARNILQITEVNYTKEVRIANTVNRAILSLTKRKVPAPYGVLVDPEEFQGDEEKHWLAFYEPVLANRDAPGRIYINPLHREWASDAAMKKRLGFSTGSRYHAIVHEMAELAYHQAIGIERFSEVDEPPYRIDEYLFQQRIRMKPKELRNAVSEYALTNHVEFVCEVFTALMLGRDELLDNKRVLEIYHELEGPRQFEE